MEEPGASAAEDGPTSAARALGARIRALRQDRGMTLAQVAAQAELSHSFLSQVERGLERMSMTSLFRVAQALGTTQQALLTDDVAAGPRASGAFHVFRANEPTPLDAGGNPARVLARDHPRFVPMLTSGTFTEDLWWVHDEDEFVFVVDGRLIMMLGDEEFVMEKGDAVYYQGGVRHRWRTQPGETASVLSVKEGGVFCR
ncbi:transcriptional regulator, XRE family with cupin sensor [Quadrisphaera granulorum]|uniref:XRE family transcriptional regulator n=2 Tax=Quadrisphaera granulorum TaxID=317664 RepID=A0A316AV61_9ACTN|nr:XRE family transcriptional regulator [Quadrisphaera granulorum]SZE96444.1 transcriptional regulator, XRE family with cupin sensor [Quadrisphaera granulorum]